jgi:large subunit ribosomal protein L14e
MELVTGQIVYSKAGRDKKRCFIILKVEGEYVYLADGELRKVESPKKKKVKHIMPTVTQASGISQKLENGEKVSNSEVRKALAEYGNNCMNL